VLVGDPTVTAGKNQESINVFKDMYGIFKMREKKEDDNQSHGGQKASGSQPKTNFKRKT
jgi:hypothetical protein